MQTNSTGPSDQAQTIELLQQLLAKAQAGQLVGLQALICTDDGREQLITAGTPTPPWPMTRS